ncbi:gas vesicle protein GvpO [Nonomuraea sp. NPDC046802]|uniref:gas vesicle protein GvpO n=1 Tax=Nonomuraea sp. NPDC046802 TaxID=3154919 RepID=UPI0033C38591
MPARRRMREEDAGGVPASRRSREAARTTDETVERNTRRRHRPGDLNAASAGEFGLRHIVDLTGRETEGVTLVKPKDDGWLVDVEVVEDRRIPSSGDILALYEAELDMEGELLSYRRLRRYRRGAGDSQEGPR